VIADVQNMDDNPRFPARTCASFGALSTSDTHRLYTVVMRLGGHMMGEKGGGRRGSTWLGYTTPALMHSSLVSAAA